MNHGSRDDVRVTPDPFRRRARRRRTGWSGRVDQRLRRRLPRIPAGRLRNGGRYAWRAWPFLRRGDTRSPLGVSVLTVDVGRR